MTHPTPPNTIDIDELCENPQMHGFTKDFRCDRCGLVLACTPDFDPPSCPTCNPEDWNGEPS